MKDISYTDFMKKIEDALNESEQLTEAIEILFGVHKNDPEKIKLIKAMKRQVEDSKQQLEETKRRIKLINN